MQEKHSIKLALTYLKRALLLKCPTCGTKPLFLPLLKTRSLHDWFTPLDGCPQCGYPYEREPGYYLMSIWAINYGFGCILAVSLYGLLEWFYDLPILQLIIAVIIPVMFFNFGFARHSKSLFLAFDLFCDPHNRKGGDDGGNRPKDPPPKGTAPTRNNPLPTSPIPADKEQTLAKF
ncbi:MAG: hypothetical protein ABI615_12265 [Chthoniobacterales bacterium]